MIITDHIHEYNPELTVDWLLEHCPVDHRFARLMSIDRSIVRCRESSATITASLFNRDTMDPTGMTRTSEPNFRKRYFASLMNNIQWMEATDMGCDLFVEPSIADEVMRHVTSAKVNLHVMKENSLAATGMYWRFLAFDMEEEWRPDQVVLCDVDLEWEHHVPFLLEHCPVAPVFYGRSGDPFSETDDCSKYTPISCGYSAFEKSSINWKFSEIVPRFFYYQCYKQFYEPRNKWNGPHPLMPHGFGNTWNLYGSDERFFAKVVYYYLKRQGCLKMLVQRECFDSPHAPEKADMEFTEKFGGKIICV